DVEGVGARRDGGLRECDREVLLRDVDRRAAASTTAGARTAAATASAAARRRAEREGCGEDGQQQDPVRGNRFHNRWLRHLHGDGFTMPPWMSVRFGCSTSTEP